MIRRPTTCIASVRVATILQLLKLPDGTVKVLVEGVDRARIEKLHAGRLLLRRCHVAAGCGERMTSAKWTCWHVR